MSPLAWLAFPLLALVVATAAATWLGRPNTRAEMRKSARRYERFKAAFADDDNRPSPRSR